MNSTILRKKFLIKVSINDVQVKLNQLNIILQIV